MEIHTLDPLADIRWEQLVSRHRRATAFHRTGWLQALKRTYGFQPVVVTTTPPGEPLNDGIVFCRVSSWITGTRFVSLPFADHCEPLVDDGSECQGLTDWLEAECQRGRWNYVELRPLSGGRLGRRFRPVRSYCFHELSLRGNLNDLLRATHKDCVRRRILRAEREGLSYEVGRSKPLLNDFYRLLLLTRRRHGLLPQPMSWFENLIKYGGSEVAIRVARKKDVAVAAMLTLRHRSTVVYKYGCSDDKLHHLGGMPFLMWRLIEEAKATGATDLDFGRSDLDNQGLILFKGRFGTTKKVLNYYRYQDARRLESVIHYGSPAMKRLFCALPDTAFTTAGRMLYRHMG